MHSNGGQTAIGERVVITPPILRSVLSTSELDRRFSRPPDYAAENQALIGLAEQLAKSPTDILQKLAETAMTLCSAQSAGISLLEADGKRFFWPAVVGLWAEHVGGGTPRRTPDPAARYSIATPRSYLRTRNVILIILRPSPHLSKKLF